MFSIKGFKRFSLNNAGATFVEKTTGAQLSMRQAYELEVACPGYWANTCEDYDFRIIKHSKKHWTLEDMCASTEAYRKDGMLVFDTVDQEGGNRSRVYAINNGVATLVGTSVKNYGVSTECYNLYGGSEEDYNKALANLEGLYYSRFHIISYCESKGLTLKDDAIIKQPSNVQYYNDGFDSIGGLPF